MTTPFERAHRAYAEAWWGNLGLGDNDEDRNVVEHDIAEPLPMRVAALTAALAAVAPPTNPSDYLAWFPVYGLPGPQGSKTATGRMRRTKAGGLTPVLRESSAKVKPWRAAVADAAITAVVATPHRPWFPLDGPLVARMVFTLPRPKSKRADEAPAADRKPDVSKLIRSTEDALTGIVWSDDARVVGYDRVWKTYPGADPDALTVPGAVVAVRRATAAELGLDPDGRDAAKYARLIEAWEAVTAADRQAELVRDARAAFGL